MGLAHAVTAKTAEWAAGPYLLPTAKLQVNPLRGLNAPLHYRADEIKAQTLPLGKVDLQLRLQNDVLRIDPFAFTLPEGRRSADGTRELANIGSPDWSARFVHARFAAVSPRRAKLAYHALVPCCQADVVLYSAPGATDDPAAHQTLTGFIILRSSSSNLLLCEPEVSLLKGCAISPLSPHTLARFLLPRLFSRTPVVSALRGRPFREVRLAGAGHALFAVTLIGIGITGLLAGRFASIWQSVPQGVPARRALAYLCAWVSLTCGAGLLVKRSAGAAARVLFAYLLLWLLLVKGYYIVGSPGVEVNYQSAGETAVLVAAAWVLSAGEDGKRHARALYAVALIAFGLSHFAYLDLTAPLVPGWLPTHVFWAYFTGAAYLAAAAAMLSGVLARLAAVLSALQMGLFTLLVWAPAAVAGRLWAGQWSEFGVSWALTAAAWVVADSLRGASWLALGKR